MAEVSLKIKSDFDKAEADFKALGATSETFQKSIKKTQAALVKEGNTIGELSKKARINAIAVTAVKGADAGLRSELSALQREMMGLIKRGLSPASPALDKMKRRMTELQGQLPKARSAVSGLTNAFKGLVAYFSVQSVFRIANSSIESWYVQETAIKNVEAGLMSTNNAIGITSKSFQEMASATQEVGIFGDEAILQNATAQFLTFGNIGASNFDRIQKSALDVTAKLKGLNATNEDIRATSIMMGKAMDDPVRGMGAMRRVGIAFSDEEENAIKAMVAHNDTIGAQNLMLKAIEKQYGGTNEALAQTSAGMERAAKNNLGDTMEQLGKAIAPIKKSLIEFALIAAKVVTPAFAIIEPVLSTIIFLLPELTAAFAAYMVVTKAAAMVTTIMAAKTAILNTVLLLNPIGLVVAAIAALVVAGIWMYKNWEVVSSKMSSIWDGMKMYAQIGWEYIKVAALTATRAIIKGLLLINKPFVFMIDNVIKAFNRLTGKSIPTMSKSISKFTGNLDRQIAKSNKKIQRLHDSRMRQLASMSKKENEVSRQQSAINKKAEKESIKKTAIKKAEVDYFKESLSVMALSEADVNAQRIKSGEEFFAKKFEMEQTAGMNLMAWQLEQTALIAENDKLSQDQKLLAMKALDKAVQKNATAQLMSQVKFGQSMLSTTGSMLSDLQTVMQNAGKDARKLAIAGKGIAIAQAIVNTALGFTKSLAAFPWPFNLVAAGVTAAAGAAQVAAISSTPIPSAETGLTNYTVPDIRSNKNDGAAVMAQAGEQVSISPRGEDGSGLTNININVSEQTIFSIVAKGIKTGQISLNNKNVGRGVFAN